MDASEVYEESSQTSAFPASLKFDERAEIYAGASQVALYQDVVGVVQLTSSSSYQQQYFESVGQRFRISFKSNEKHLKNPNQVIADDTLHCAPNKLVCIYLGEKFNLPTIPPRVLVYLKFNNDKMKNNRVVPCDKHAFNDPYRRYHVIHSNDVGVVYRDDEERMSYVLDFPYPSHMDIPSISISFGCSSSCFNRAIFELRVDLCFAEGFYIPQKHLVKVSANPGRDSGQPGIISSQFARIKGALTLKSRARKLTSDSDGPPSCKRSSVVLPDDVPSPPAVTLPENGVYSLTIYGTKSYKDVLNYYNMMNITDKYYLLKNFANQAGVLNSQIAPTESLDAWLEKARMKKHRDAFSVRGINTMVELQKLYGPDFFEKIGIPHEDTGALHSSFIYWQTSYLNELFKTVHVEEEDVMDAPDGAK